MKWEMKKKSLIILSFLLVAPSQSGCGLAVLGGIYGVTAIKKKGARDDAFKRMAQENTQGESALKANKPTEALQRFSAAQSALYAYYFQYEGSEPLNKLAAEYPEISRTARGLVQCHLKLKNECAAVASAAAMLPEPEAHDLLTRAQLIQVEEEAVAAAPHMYAGKKVEWHGEVTSARHDPETDVMYLMVVPYTWERRQVGMRTEQYYDHDLKINRDRLVPVYKDFKVPLHNKQFAVELKGFNSQITSGRAASFLGVIGDGSAASVVMTEAVATKIFQEPGGNSPIWYLGIEVPAA